MKKQTIAAFVSMAIGIMVADATTTFAAVNCGIVKKDLNLGRKPEDIAERMGISVADVNTCKAQGGTGTTDNAAPTGAAAPGSPGSPTPDTAPKGVMPPATGSKAAH